MRFVAELACIHLSFVSFSRASHACAYMLMLNISASPVLFLQLLDCKFFLLVSIVVRRRGTVSCLHAACLYFDRLADIILQLHGSVLWTRNDYPCNPFFLL